MKKNKIFIACDTPNISKVNEIIKKTQNPKLKIGYKFGLEFLNSKIQVQICNQILIWYFEYF